MIFNKSGNTDFKIDCSTWEIVDLRKDKDQRPKANG